jgi:hypoxanthine-DNA glycosylase
VHASAGFAPVCGPDATLLILGSLPGTRSLETGEYYAHARNAFWRIMSELFGANGDYRQRCETLVRARVALWDVLAESVRPGSLDTAIRMDTARVNDFPGFLEVHPDIGTIGFNGRKAETMFRRLVVPQLGTPIPELVTLPSTSPAHATLTVDDKLRIWRERLLAETQ